MTPEYEAFMELVKERHSTRKFKSDAVSRELLDAVLEAARLAPSACNLQPWRFMVVDHDGEAMEGVRGAYRKEGFRNAPATIIAVGLHDTAWHRADDNKDHTDVDVSIAVEHICLAAAALGLSTCWVCSFDVDKVRHTLHLSDSEEPVALIPIGYPDDTVTEKKRKPMAEIVTYL